MTIKVKMSIRPPGSNPGQDGPNPGRNRGLDGGWGTDVAIGSSGGGRSACRSGFTLVETMVATFIAAIVLPTLFAGLASGFWLIQAAREDSRATQVILQRMEAIRLSPYKSLQDPSAYPTNVVEYYSESGKTNGQGGAAYKVAYNWTPAPSSLPPSYRTNVLLVSVTASWKTGDLERSRSMQTYVARYGIRRYVCGN